VTFVADEYIYLLQIVLLLLLLMLV